MLMLSTCMLLSHLWSPLMQCFILYFILLQVMGLELITVFFRPSLSVRREQHSIFIHKALLHVLPNCLTNVISFRTCNLHTHSQESLILNFPNVRTALGKDAFQVYAPQKWKDLQRALELNHLISLDSFKCLFFNGLKSVIVIYDHTVYGFSCILYSGHLWKRELAQLTFPK